MHSPSEFFLDTSEGAVHPLFGWFAPDPEFPSQGFDAIVCHAHEVEGFWFSQPAFVPSCYRIPSERNEAGFVGVQVQPELGKPCSQVVQEALRFPLMLKADNEVIRIADDDHVPFPLPFAP